MDSQAAELEAVHGQELPVVTPTVPVVAPAETVVALGVIV